MGENTSISTCDYLSWIKSWVLCIVSSVRLDLCFPVEAKIKWESIYILLECNSEKLYKEIPSKL